MRPNAADFMSSPLLAGGAPLPLTAIGGGAGHPHIPGGQPGRQTCTLPRPAFVFREASESFLPRNMDFMQAWKKKNDDKN